MAFGKIMRKLQKWYLLVILLVIVISLGWFIRQNWGFKGIEHLFSIPTTQAQEPLSESPNLDSWINMLEREESGRRTYLKVYDPPNHSVKDKRDLYSFGCLQFKYSTLDYYADRYGLGTGVITEKELKDCQFQKMVAKKMIEENRMNALHWRNVVLNKIGFPPISKELAKR